MGSIIRVVSVADGKIVRNFTHGDRHSIACVSAIRLAAAGEQRGRHLLEAAHKKFVSRSPLDERFDGTVFAWICARRKSHSSAQFQVGAQVVRRSATASCLGASVATCRAMSCAVAGSCRGSSGGTGASMSGGTISVAACRIVSRAVAASCRGSCGGTGVSATASVAACRAHVGLSV